MSTWPFHGGNTENDGFYTAEHGIYKYIPGNTPVHAGVITERTVSAGPYTVDSRTFTDGYGRTQMSTNEQDLSWMRRYPWSYRKPCTVRDQPMYNQYTSMLVCRKYSYTDSPGLYTVTSVAIRYLQVYTRNQHG